MNLKRKRNFSNKRNQPNKFKKRKFNNNSRNRNSYPDKKSYADKKSYPDDKKSYADYNNVSKSKQKKLDIHLKREQHITNYSALRESNKLFETFKLLNNNPESENASSVVNKTKLENLEKIFSLLKGNVITFSRNSNGIHLLCSIMKYSSKKRKKQLFQECKGHLLALCGEQMSRHLVESFYSLYPECRPLIVNELKPHVLDLIVKKYSAKIINMLYERGTIKEKNLLYSGFFGVDYVFENKKDDVFNKKIIRMKMFFEENPNLPKEIYEKRMKRILDKIVEKEIIVNSFSLRLFIDFFEVGNKTEVLYLIKDLLPFVPLFLHMGDDGLILSVYIFSYSDVKQRKELLKELSPHVKKLCVDKYGVLLLCYLLSCYDDTVFMYEKILKHVMSNIDMVAGDKNARKVLLHLMDPLSKRYFHINHRSMIVPELRRIQECYNNENSEIIRVSKKDFGLINTQNLNNCKDVLIKYCSSNLVKLMKGFQNFVFEILKSFDKEDSIKMVHQSIIDMLMDEKSEKRNVCQVVFKVLVNAGNTVFSKLIYDKVKSNLKQFIEDENLCLIVVGVLKTEQFMKKMVSILSQYEKEIEQRISINRTFKFLNTVYKEKCNLN